MWTPKDEEEVDECFEMFDEEAEELLAVNIIGKMMGLLGWNPTKQDLDDLVRKVRFKKIDRMDKREFKQLMKMWYENHTKDDEEQLRNAFQVFDSDGSGFIEWEELQYVLQGCGEPLTNEELALMMKEADKDGDGRIDYQEFVAMMRGDQELLK